MRKVSLPAAGLLAVVVLALAALGGGQARAANADNPVLARAFAAGDAGKWAQARRLAAKSGDALGPKLITWLRLTGDGPRFGFAEYADFIQQNPDWPALRQLRRRAEEAMTERLAPAQVRAWFDDFQPVSADGRIRLAAALLAGGETAAARTLLRQSWVRDNFAAGQERGFYRLYRKYLTREDHISRLDRLLWEDRRYAVRRMYRRVNPGYRALAEARVALRRAQGGVDGAISRVPETLRRDPGLIYERLRWRRRKGRDLAARELLENPPENLVRPEKWWAERALLSRRALRQGHITAAYDLAANQNLAGGPELAEAEWLAGWIALRFLGDAAVALGHFTKLYDKTRYPISRARGAYWAARAAEAQGDDTRARAWYRAAAAHPTTYYGQLAAAKNGEKPAFALPPEPAANEENRKRFAASELVFAVKALAAGGAAAKIRPFIRRLYRADAAPGWRRLVAALAAANKRPDLAVWTARRAVREGVTLIELGYPVLSESARYNVENSLVHAVIRQESAFDAAAVSPAGARGLMQLMPLTARKIAKKLNTPYVRSRLTRIAAYNLKLGQAHLGDLIREFEGSYILALAAYNAGPGRVRRWSKSFGDPRESGVDAIDWVEMIPFSETRNYVQRVIENLNVYRHRLGEGDSEIAFNPLGDLRR